MLGIARVSFIDTPNGRVDFVEFIGVTDAELKKITDKEITVKEAFPSCFGCAGRRGEALTERTVHCCAR